MKLQIFDFDDTLFRTPAPSGIPLRTSDSLKWYDTRDSLNPDKYSIHCIETVARIARESQDSPDTKRILITRRIPELTADILYLLRENGIMLDKHYVIGHHTEKPDVLAEILAKDYAEHDFDEIEIYEDCMYQILAYERFFKAIHYPKSIDVRYFFVDKTHLITFPFGVLKNAMVLDKLKINYP